MPDLKSMKISFEEKREMAQPSVLERDQFPYGLVLNFDEDSFKKLGLSEKPEIGQKFMVMALAEVKTLDQSKGVDDIPRMTMSLQITDIAIEPKKEERSAAETLFGGSESVS